jgi:predicted O-methyltransferase YrrM
MNKFSKHVLICKRRFKQKAVLKRLSGINNLALKRVISAITETLSDSYSEQDCKAFNRCEAYRKELLQDQTEINYRVFGSDKTAQVREICKKAPSSAIWCRFLFKLAIETESRQILEIGTNLGISGSYILEALKDLEGNLTTMEGLPQLCEIAENQFSKISPNSRFRIIQGLYDDTFPGLLEEGKGFDLIFVDGNHKKEPTLHYFRALKSLMDQTAIFVFDDIYWSEEMTEAWQIIQNDPDVNFSIDLFMMGIAIIDKDESIKNSSFSLHMGY